LSSTIYAVLFVRVYQA